MAVMAGALATLPAMLLPYAARRHARLHIRHAASPRLARLRSALVPRAAQQSGSGGDSASVPHDLSHSSPHHGVEGHDLQQRQQEDLLQAQQSVEDPAAEEYTMQTMEAAASSHGPGAHHVVVPSGPVGAAQQMLRTNPAVGVAVSVAVGFLGVTFLVALVRTGLKAMSPEAKRGRTINKNKLVVDEIRKFLPGNRAGLTAAAMGRLRFQTGFSSVEVFRKYLWFLLRERTFDSEAVEDLVALKAALGLTDEEVAEALRERAQRIYEKYGNVMLDTAGMSKAGVERKATTRALYSKLQYLLDYEPLLSPAAAESVSLRDIFGATEQDAARLRIVSLQEVDLDKLAAMPTVEGVGEHQQQQQQPPQQQEGV